MKQWQAKPGHVSTKPGTKKPGRFTTKSGKPGPFSARHATALIDAGLYSISSIVLRADSCFRSVLCLNYISVTACYVQRGACGVCSVCCF